MYDTNYTCIYNKEDLFIDTDNLTEEQMSMIRDDLYRNDMLNIFQLKEYNEEILEKELDDLHSKISTCEILVEYILKMMGEYYGTSMTKDTKFGIVFLFTFENMYLFHPCICDYLLYEEIK